MCNARCAAASVPFTGRLPRARSGCTSTYPQRHPAAACSWGFCSSQGYQGGSASLIHFYLRVQGVCPIPTSCSPAESRSDEEASFASPLLLCWWMWRAASRPACYFIIRDIGSGFTACKMIWCLLEWKFNTVVAHTVTSWGLLCSQKLRHVCAGTAFRCWTLQEKFFFLFCFDR